MHIVCVCIRVNAARAKIRGFFYVFFSMTQICAVYIIDIMRSDAFFFFVSFFTTFPRPGAVAIDGHIFPGPELLMAKFNESVF